MSNWYRQKIQLSAVEEACEDYELSSLHHSQDSEMSQVGSFKVEFETKLASYFYISAVYNNGKNNCKF